MPEPRIVRLSKLAFADLWPRPDERQRATYVMDDNGVEWRARIKEWDADTVTLEEIVNESA